MFLAKLSINRPVLTTMLILVFIVFGLLAYFTLPLNLMPDVEIPFVTVQTVYVGAGPQEIETQISQPIEDAVSTVSGIDFIQSFSMENVSYVLIGFDFRKDTEIAYREVRENIDRVMPQLPGDADMPIVGRFDFTAMPILNLVVSAPGDPTELYEYTDTFLRDRFSQIEGVASVNISGGQRREIQVLFDREKAEQYAISIPQISGVIAAHNMDMPGGQFQKDGQEYTVRLVGEFKDLHSLRNLDVPTAFGIRKLSQIADIRDTVVEERERTAYYNAKTGERMEDVISIGLVASPDGNVVDISNEVKRALPLLEEELPAGYEINLVRDSAVFIEDTFEDTIGNILLGILLTGLILFFFLSDLRSTFIVALAMPTSIISSFLMLQIFGYSLNLMTLMGFSVSVGILVTNSVVVLENIFRHKAKGHSRKEAADIGTSEITVAVIASTLTNIMVFLPIAAMTTLVGQFFTEFALAVTFATVFSLLISFTLTPMLASIILPQKENNGRFSNATGKVFRKWEIMYKKMLTSILSRKRNAAFLVSSAIVLFLLSFLIARTINFEFMPFTDEGDITIEVELPEGYALDETAKLLERVDNVIAGYPEVEQMVTTLGSIGRLAAGTNLARTRVSLVDRAERDLSTRQVADRMTSSLADIPNAEISVTAVSAMGGGGMGDSPVEFYLQGREMETLSELTDQIMEKVPQAEGLINFDTSLRPGSPQLTYSPRMDKLSEAGLSIQELAMALRTSIEGTVATKYREAGNEYDIRVRLDRESVNTPHKIDKIPVSTRNGQFVLSQLADVDFTEGPSMIMRRDKMVSVEFTGDLASGYPLGLVRNNIQSIIEDDIDLPAGYEIEWGGEAEMLMETTFDMLRTFLIAVLLTYMLLAALLESFLQPLFILGTLPFALIGVFAAMFITAQTMNIVSMMAIIMLVGIVVNNAILMLDYTNMLVRKEGKPPKEALITACPTKLRPIVMASLAIILGMMPMALGLGAAGREFRQPMGIVSIGGLFVSMLLSLFVIPSLYYLFIKSRKTDKTVAE